MQKLSWPCVALCLVVSLFLLPANAAEQAAQVILARDAQALGADGVTRTLARRDKVFVGDTLTTAGSGMLQVRFVDKALLTLRENSRFRIETYAPPTDGGGTVLMQLVEGGFRTITGSIGKGSQDSYKVTTGAASIGIRGTHYEVVQESAKAIVVAVWHGAISVDNENGSLDLGQDMDFSYSRVESGKAPVGLLEPPAAFQQGPVTTQNNPPASTEENQEAVAENSSETSSGTSTSTSTTTATGSTSSSFTATAPTTTQTSLSPTLGSTTTATSPTTTQTLDFTVTDTQLQETLQPIETDPVGDPWTTKSTYDPRLYVAELDQFTDPARRDAVIVTQNPEIVLATLISPDTPTLYDFANNGPISFDVKYFIDDGSAAPATTTVNILLDKNHTSLNALISDIQEHLSAASALVGVRESTLNPGHLEFYTANPSNLHLHFELINFDLSASSAQVLEVAAALGGLVDGAFASGFRDGYPMRAAVVFGQDGKPSAFLAPEFKSSSTAQSALDVGRQGDAVLLDYNPTVGGRSNISWGRWAASAANPIHIYGEINTPDTITSFEDDSAYWLTAEAATASQLTGNQTFQMGSAPVFLGTGSDGAVQAMSGGFSVDFTTGAINSGYLSLTTANQNWSTQFNGNYTNGHALMDIHTGYISGNVNCSNCVTGSISGIFAAPGDRFVGGYDMFKIDQPAVNNQGVLLMERQ
nr:FecR family protein [uncultured Pseudomonas sp.]